MAKTGLPWYWRALEAAFRSRYGMETLDDDPEALLAYHPATYRGPELRLACGSVLRDGDPLLEMHFRREALLPLIREGDPRRMGLGLLRLADRDLPRLARRVRGDDRLRQARALHALTLFHRGIDRFGFEVRPVEATVPCFWFTLWHRLLMARDHPGGWRHVWRHRGRLVTRHVYLPVERLLERYPE